jgi:ectoine hydroxylase-related dioxygenase (phytanoyl-CoA dioxygenase family)
MRVDELAARICDEGFAIWHGFLDSVRLADLRSAAAHLLTGEHAHRYPKSTRAWDLHLHGHPFIDVLMDPRLADLLNILLRDRHLLSDFSLNQVLPGQPVDDWHIDYPYNEMPTLVTGSILGLQCVLALDRFDEVNGATQLQPGTHRTPTRPAEPYGLSVSFDAEPGTLLVMAVATWHRSGPNRSSDPRTAMLMSFVEGWIKPMSAPTDGLNQPVPGRLASLLGLDAVVATINGVPI